MFSFLVLLVAAIVMFALDQPRMDVVALIMTAALPLNVIIMKDGVIHKNMIS